MVESTSPIDSDVGLSVEKQASCINTGPRTYLTHVVESVESWAVRRLSYFETLPHFQNFMGLGVCGGVRKAIDADKCHTVEDIPADELFEV